MDKIYYISVLKLATITNLIYALPLIHLRKLLEGKKRESL